MDKAKKTVKSVSTTAAETRPDWAKGLRHLYDSVLEEPLPDSFAVLLSKLDQTGK